MQLFLVGDDLFQDITALTGWGVLVKVPREGDFIPDFVLAAVRERVRDEGKDFVFDILVNILLEGDDLGVPAFRVDLNDATLDNLFAVLVIQRAFHSHFGIAEVIRVKKLADFGGRKGGISPDDLSAVLVIDELALIS